MYCFYNVTKVLVHPFADNAALRSSLQVKPGYKRSVKVQRMVAGLCPLFRRH